MDELVLHEGIKELGQNGTLGGHLGQLHVVLLGGGDGILVGLPVVEVYAGILLHGFHHGQALPVTHVDLLALIGDDHAAADLLGKALVQLLHQIHHAVEVGEGLIQLDAGELRVVLGVHALVAEDAAHLVHAVHAAHDQALEVQLGLNAQHHVHVQAVVMGVEGACGCADLEGGQDGGVHLQEALLVQIGADLLQDLAALHEGVLHLGVCNQVHVALTVTHLGVGQAVELLGQGTQALGQQGQLGGAHAQFAGLGAEHLALHADDIAHVQLLEGGVRLFAQLIAADVQLNVALIVPQVGKACLAHYALGHHTASQRHGLAAVGLVGQVGKLGLQVGRVGILRVLGQGEGVVACSLQVGQLLAAHLHLLALGQALRRVLLLFFHGFSYSFGLLSLQRG